MKCELENCNNKATHITHVVWEAEDENYYAECDYHYSYPAECESERECTEEEYILNAVEKLL